MKCNDCGVDGMWTVGPSEFPGFDLMACKNCGRPVRLIVVGGPRPGGTKPLRKADTNRALRAARRMKQRRHGD